MIGNGTKNVQIKDTVLPIEPIYKCKESPMPSSEVGILITTERYRPNASLTKSLARWSLKGKFTFLA